MPKITLKIDKDIFNPVYYPYLNDNTPTQIFFGGSSSGKSYFLAQRCVYDMAKGGRNYLILRKVQRDCRKSVWNEVKKQIKKFGLWDYVETNKTEMTITFPNGYQIIFGGLDDRERVKSMTPEKGVITDIWLEEATEFEQDDLKQLEKRLRGRTKATKRVTLSFNPIIKTHWIYKEYFDRWEDDKNEYRSDRLSILKTTYRDNEFLTQDDIDRLLDEDDAYYIDVYVEGNWGVLGNIIFTNWEMRDISHMRNRLDRSAHGGDFGFSDDPAAVAKQYFDKSSKTLYVFDELYKPGLTDPQLADEIKDMFGQEEVIFDSAEPKSIKHLNNNGINARGAKKGPGSVETRYRWYQSIKVVLHVTCVNFKRELQTHQWKEDKDGNVLPVPEDKNNHLIDASMYGLSDYWNLNQSEYYSQDFA
ncbi:MAG: PBSX family phage terminase large subunit [bacterium]